LVISSFLSSDNKSLFPVLSKPVTKKKVDERIIKIMKNIEAIQNTKKENRLKLVKANYYIEIKILKDLLFLMIFILQLML
jgi:hypothetical protein